MQFPEVLSQELPTFDDDTHKVRHILEVRQAANDFYARMGIDVESVEYRMWESQFDLWLYRVFAQPSMLPTGLDEIVSSYPEIDKYDKETLTMTRGEYYMFITAAAVASFIMGMGIAAQIWGPLCGA